MRHYPDFIEAFLEYAADIEAPRNYLRWSALSVVSSALERKVWLTNGKWTYYPNLFIMLIGDAGVRKTSASQVAISLLKSVPEIGWLPNKLNEATFIRDLSEIGAKKKFHWHGKDYRMSSGFIYAAEASTTFKDMYKGGGIIEMLTDLYDGGQSGWSETSSLVKSTQAHGKESLHNPLISFLACTTPAMLPLLVSRSEAAGGFGSRTLLVVHKGTYDRSHAWVDEDHENVGMKLKLQQDLREINKLQGAYQPTADFKEFFQVLGREHQKRMDNTAAHPLIIGFLTRKVAHAAKLSQVLAASRHNQLKVEAKDLERAWNHLGELEPLMLEAYGEIATTPQSRARSEVWDWIKRRPTSRFMKTEVQSHFQSVLDMRVVTQALQELQEMGKIQFLFNESKNGRFVYLRLEETSSGEQSQPGLKL